VQYPEIRVPVRTIGSRTFDFSRQIAVMAVINRTPDSFYDRGRTFALDAAIEASLGAARLGADWIDIGGVKFGPGPEVPADEEIERVVPVIEAVSRASDVVISVDTFRPEVAARQVPASSTTRPASSIRSSRMSSRTATRPSSSPTVLQRRGSGIPGRSTRMSPARSPPSFARGPSSPCRGTSPRSASSSTPATT